MKLIIAADDFGMSEAYSLGVMKACREGVASVAGLMPNMDAAPFAVALQKRDLPGLCLVQHTNFVQGAPCARPEDIPSLVDVNGMFRKSAAYKSGEYKITYEDAKKETTAQMERFKELTGAYPIHVEGHSFFDEDIARAMQDAAAEKGAHVMELRPDDQEGFEHAREAALEMMHILNQGTEVEDFLEDRFGLLKGETDKVRVLHFHPGYLDQYLLDNTSLTLPRCKDHQTLCDPRVRRWLDEHGIELVDYRAIVKQ